MNKNIKQTVLPLITALIWGTAFVYQDIASEYVEPFTFNFLRAVIAVVFLAIISFFVDTYKRKALKIPVKTDYKKLLISGFVCGVCLFLASNFQQFAIDGGSESGKVAFITALYMVLVPIVGLFFKKKVGLFVWIALVFAVLGVYFLCVQQSLTIRKSDIFALVCAIGFTAHILIIDHYSQFLDGIKLSLLQFAVVAVLCFISSLIFEKGNIANFKYCIFPVLFVGLLSSGVGYTLQIIAQKGTNPTIVSLFLSLESLFAVLSGAIITHERLDGRAYIGCTLMMIAIILSQIKIDKKAKNVGKS